MPRAADGLLALTWPPKLKSFAATCSIRPIFATALQNVSTAYYLVHSMGSPGSFEEKDREGARNFAAAAGAAGVRRIIYLGGLGGEQ